MVDCLRNSQDPLQTERGSCLKWLLQITSILAARPPNVWNIDQNVIARFALDAARLSLQDERLLKHPVTGRKT